MAKRSLFDLEEKLRNFFNQGSQAVGNVARNVGNFVQQDFNRAPQVQTARNVIRIARAPQVQQAVKQAPIKILNSFNQGANAVGNAVGNQNILNFPQAPFVPKPPAIKIKDVAQKLTPNSAFSAFTSGQTQKIPSLLNQQAKGFNERQKYMGYTGDDPALRKKQTEAVGESLAMVNIGGFAKPQLKKAADYLAKVADKDAVAKISDFVIDVQKTGGNKNYGELGKDMHAIARDVFGDNARNLSNKQLANVLDATLKNVGKQPNRFNLGLATEDIRGGKRNVAGMGGVKPSQMTSEEFARTVNQRTPLSGDVTRNNILKATNEANKAAKQHTANIQHLIPTQAESNALEAKLGVNLNTNHKFWVAKALDEGQVVPPNVLKEYPDLVQTIKPNVANAGLGDIAQEAEKLGYKVEFINKKPKDYYGKHFSDKKTVEIYTKGRTPEQIQDTLDHELGHIIDYQRRGIVADPMGDSIRGYDGKLRAANDSDIYFRQPFLEKEAENIRKEIPKIHSASTTQKEIYADAYKLYKRNPERLKEIAPNIYKQLDEHLTPHVAQQPIPDISAEAFKTKGKIKVTNIPTQTAIKNRAEIKAGNPDLYDQRTGKLKEAYGEPLPWETNQSVVESNMLKGKMQPQKSQLVTKNAKNDIPQPFGQQAQTQQRGQKTIGEFGDQTFDDIVRSSDIDVKKKANIIDYVRTPDRVLKKFGLEQESNQLRKGYDNYITQLPKEIDKITQWSKQVRPESNQRIFQYLDGKPVQLDQNEMQVAKEVKSYLSDWADKLKLPKDKRITNYITHIFDKDFIQKEFDPEIAKLIRDRVPGSVYDPFVEQRLGKAGYLEDTWQALDAYVKRATRKVNMDDALNAISAKAGTLENSQFNYVKKYLDRVNMRPTETDDLIDNTLKSVIGYQLGQRPTTTITRGLRQAVYRGTLGLNLGSALRNLTQGANTYAKLGEKHTIKGYLSLAKAIASGSDELERVGVLKQDFIQDRSLNATHKFWEKADKGLFSFFELAEKINRGSAYFGAKSKALSQGLDEAKAIEYAKKIVRDTQFTFGSVDTPQVLQSDIAKSLLQFQSYNLKQSEFLAEMVNKREIGGVIRWAGANLAAMLTVGKLIGMKPQDMIPFTQIISGQSKLGETPPVKLAQDIAGAVVGANDKYGNEQDAEDYARNIGKDLIPFIPAGVQIKKTLEGIRDVSRGEAQTRSGNNKFDIAPTMENLLRGGAFGTNNLPEARDYYNKGKDDPKQITSGFGADFNIMDMFGGGKKKEDAVKIKWKNENGDSESVDLSTKVNDAKAGSLASFEKDNSNISKARKLYGADPSQVSHETKMEAFKKLGFTEDEVRYDVKANFSGEEKANYIAEQNLDHETLIERLIDGRRESVGGKRFAADGVLDELYKMELISNAERKYLKSLKTDSKGKAQAGSGGKGGKGKKPKKFSFPKVTKVNLKFGSSKFGGGSKLPAIKLAKPPQSKIKISSDKKVKLITPKQGKAYTISRRQLQGLSQGIKIV